MSDAEGLALKARREAMGLDRTPVAAAAGITVAQLGTLELHGRRGKVIERRAKVTEVLDAFEANGIPEGTNKRRGRKASADKPAADAGSGEGDPAPVVIARPTNPIEQLSSSEQRNEMPPMPELRQGASVPTWGDYNAGDPVATSTYPGQAFDFVAFVQPMGGKPYVSIWGGKRGQEKMRSVDPTTIRKVTRRGRPAAGSADTDVPKAKRRGASRDNGPKDLQDLLPRI